jgi:apolipoprotein N-acyltransferase
MREFCLIKTQVFAPYPFSSSSLLLSFCCFLDSSPFTGCSFHSSPCCLPLWFANFFSYLPPAVGGFYTLTFSFAPSCRFVDLLGGNIWAESEAGKGSTFFFCVPFLLTTSKDSPPRANKGCIWCYNCECILVCLLCFSILEHEMNHSKEGQVRYMGCIP